MSSLDPMRQERFALALYSGRWAPSMEECERMAGELVRALECMGLDQDDIIALEDHLAAD